MAVDIFLFAEPLVSLSIASHFLRTRDNFLLFLAIIREVDLLGCFEGWGGVVCLIGLVGCFCCCCFVSLFFFF